MIPNACSQGQRRNDSRAEIVSRYFVVIIVISHEIQSAVLVSTNELEP